MAIPSTERGARAARWLAAGLVAIQPLAISSLTASPRQSSADAVVSGVVIETDGTPVPGANVVLEGPIPGDAQRRALADRDGRFRFARVAPGGYRLRVELPGLSAPGDVEIQVRSGQQLATTLVLSLFAFNVDVQIAGTDATPGSTFDVDSTADRRQLSNRALTRLPLPAEDALEALPVLPGVVRGPRGLISVGGNLPEDSAFLFNGADLQDVYNGQYRFRVPLDAIDSIDVRSGVFSAATTDRLGGVIDVTTAGGTDTWEFSAGSFLPRPWFRDGGIAGVRRFSPRIRFAGPLTPGRAFFSQSLEYRFERERVRDVPHESGDHVRVEGWEWLSQLDISLGRDHQLRLAGFLFPETRRYVGLDGLTPLESTRIERNRSAAVMGRHQWRLDDRSFLDTTAQYSRVSVNSRPAVRDESAGFRLFPDGVSGPAFHTRDRASEHWQIKSIYRRALGADTTRHVLQVGAELHHLAVEGRHASSPVRIEDAGGGLLRRVEFDGSTTIHGSKNEWALFAQHRYKPADRFWIDVGVRLFRDAAASGAAFGPRLGIAWDLEGGGRTLLKAGIGILHRRIYLGEMLWEQNPQRIETADGRTTRWRPRIAGPLRSPRAVLTTLELTHRFAPSLTARVRGSLRESSRRLVFDLVDETIRLQGTGSATSRELEVTLNYRPGTDSQLFLSYVRSSATGDLNGFVALSSTDPDPVLHANAAGPLPIDTPNRLVAWGVLSLPAGLQIAPVIEWRDGFPYSRLTVDQRYDGAPNTARFPSYVSADVNLTKAIGLFGRTFRAGLQVRNLTGHFNPRDVIASAGSERAGRFLNDDGRRFRIRFSTRF